MVAIYLAPFYLLVCVYILLRSLHWFQVLHTVFRNVWVCRGIGLVYLFVMFSILIAFMAPASGFRRFMKLLSNYWLGVLMYTLMTLGIADGLRLLLKYPLRNFAFPGRELLFSNMGTAVVGAVCAVIISTVSIYGVLSAGNIHTTKYNISVDKKAGNMKELNVVLVADLHLGYNIGCKQMEQMTEKINEQNPDLVVVAGDIFDNEYEALDDPKHLSETLHQIQSKYGTYAVYGNHDVKETLVAGFSIGASKKALRDPRMDEFMEEAGITVLEDESELIDQKFYLVGRLDGEKNGRGTSKRKSIEELTADLDQTKPLFVMNHEPDELKEYDKAGVDVLFSGHTHAGQFFPLTIVQPFAWKNYWGVKQIGDMYSIVTSGVGVYGPNIRVGTDSEIMVVTVHFE